VKVDLGIWSKLTQAVIALVAAAVLALIALAYKDPIQQNERLRREIDQLTLEQKQQENIARQLRAEIDALRNDPQTVTRLVREKLGYAKTNETVIRFEPVGSNPPSRR
jgi:cell division protein FtsB